MSKPLLLEEAERDLKLAARKAERLRGEYNASVREWKAAKLRWEKLHEGHVMALVDLENARQRALAAGNVELAKLLVP
jgi:hypothetical protein